MYREMNRMKKKKMKAAKTKKIISTASAETTMKTLMKIKGSE
jgi:hypothetical protein